MNTASAVLVAVAFHLVGYLPVSRTMVGRQPMPQSGAVHSIICAVSRHFTLSAWCANVRHPKRRSQVTLEISMTLRDHDLIFRRPPLINDHFTEQGSHLEESVD
jgi:hypothetical protein